MSHPFAPPRLARRVFARLRGFALPVLAVAAVLLLLLFAAAKTSALPEYSAQTGEPCATCHASPSGGGVRTPRGQAWVGEGRPGSVPALTDALALLGVRLTAVEADFAAPPGAVAPVIPFEPVPEDEQQLAEWLRDREGN